LLKHVLWSYGLRKLSKDLKNLNFGFWGFQGFTVSEAVFIMQIKYILYFISIVILISDVTLLTEQKRFYIKNGVDPL